MAKRAYVFIGSFLISMSSFGAPTSLDCQSSTLFENNLAELTTVAEKVVEPECKMATREQFKGLCNSIKKEETGRNPKIKGARYHEELWRLACADPMKDSAEQAKIKINKMWNVHKKEFRCWGYTDVSVSDGNVLKFSMDVGFSEFVKNVVETYDFDLNFEDPADGLTILDFVKRRIGDFQKKKDEDKVEEFEEVYAYLLTKGAKHSLKFQELPVKP